jgi:Rod binding domain-containing protein
MMSQMFDSELAKQMTKNRSMGIAEMVYRKLTGEALEQQPVATQALHESDAHKKTIHAKQQEKKAIESVKTDRTEKSNHTSSILDTVAPQKRATSGMKTSATLDERLGKLQSIIDDAAQEHGVDSTLVKAVIASESAGNNTAQSPQHAKGIMQLIDSTATAMGVQNVWNPEQNIHGGVKYLKQMLDKFNGNVTLALASYNAGPGAVERHGGVPPFKETHAYINRVMKYWQYFQQQEVETHED